MLIVKIVVVLVLGIVIFLNAFLRPHSRSRR